VRTSDFDYPLPPELIAQGPVSPRDNSRLFVICSANDNPEPERASERERFGVIADHRHFYELDQLLRPDDVLVFNDSKVFPARLIGQKETGGKIEVLLLEETSPGTWSALLKPGKNAEGTTIHFPEGLEAQVKSRQDEVFQLEFNQAGAELDQTIDKIGIAPTPPYIKNPPKDAGKYQTVYAQHRGSAAAPTAGFHFTKELLAKLEKKGIQLEYVTLHVGLGTFQPVKEENPDKHKIHTERYSVLPETWQRIKQAKEDGRRIIAVGTTSCRVLETIAAKPSQLTGATDLFIKSEFKFQIIDSLITNFHLPKSTLLMLVAAFLGDKLDDSKRGLPAVKALYQEAVDKKYRFHSFGDAMFID